MAQGRGKRRPYNVGCEIIAADMALSTGTRLGPYEIQAPIGAGGMGEVYRARDTRLERTVAIKVLPAHLSSNPDLRQRFEREARTISSLNHPHICTLHDIGHQDGTDYLVMEHLEGETLAQRLQKGSLPTEQLLRYAIQITDALDKAHRQGVTHRDLKPANVMLTKGGCKLLDFGLAKFRRVDPMIAASTGGGTTESGTPAADKKLTVEGTILGTFQYMAPEQLEGKEADARTDIFSLGAVLYEMATGRPAFQGRSRASLIAAILEHEPEPMTDLQPMAPPALARVVETCLAKDPDERWQTAHDVKLQLQWIAEGGSQAGLPVPVVARRRLREQIWIAAAMALAATVAGLLFTRPRPAPVEAGAVRFSIPLPEKATYAPGGTLALSPDGRRLAFRANKPEGKTVLWLRPLDSFTAQPLAGTEGAAYPFWSPDARFIAFFADQRLKKIELGSGNVETICEAGTGGGGTWNRDGVIVFAANWEGPLMRVPAAGGAAMQLTQLDAAHQEVFHLWPHFLPDGRHYLFVLYGRDNSGIYAGTLDSQERKRLIAIESVNDATTVVHAPPGYLLFLRNRVLMAQRFDAARLELRGEAIRLAEGLEIRGPGVVPLSVSGTGALAYRLSGEIGAMQPTWFARDGKQLGTVGPPGPYSSFDLSPDGRTLAVSRTEAQVPTSLWLIDVARATATRFTSDWFSFAPRWSPEGDRLLFCSARDSPPNLYLKSLSGAGEERLHRSPNQSYPTDWSSDGRFIVYFTVDPKTRTDIWVLPLAGDRKATPLLQTPANEDSGRISPDVKWLAFTSDESGKSEVFITSFPTPGRKWQISTNGGFQPQWRGDGKELFYQGADNKLMSVAITPGPAFDAGVPRELFPMPAGVGSSPNPSRSTAAYLVAADGKRFLVNVEVAKPIPQPIQVVLNWTAVLRR